MSWALALLGIAALILLHEVGHFAVAKAVGMRVERFSLFFPPIVFRVRRGETEYAIGAIPLGGYVKIAGMNPEELTGEGSAFQKVVGAIEGAPVTAAQSEGTPAPDAAPSAPDPELVRRAYYNQPVWKRVAVIFAGPGVNILIAFGLFWAMLAAGNVNAANTLESLNPSVKAVRARVPTTSVGGVIKNEPADGVLREGDEILAIDGHKVTVASAQATITADRCAGALTEGCRAKKPISLSVRRDGHTLDLSVYPRYDAHADKMLVGFDFGEAVKPFGVLATAGTALHEMWAATTSMLGNLKRAFTSSKVRHELHSIVGITEVTHEAVSAGAGYALVFLGFISLVLAVINLFPFLPLDGGHILWALAEKVRGKRVSLVAMYRYSSVGIVLLLFLVVNGLSNDIGRIT
ncbi:MAG TPA: site-2 protease family protein [Solirubrobacteraceae bacterium]|jgi:regulator of sigma E protease|nr:site-2 protease family protein [Solirubrobacteraceae bacterium]